MNFTRSQPPLGQHTSNAAFVLRFGLRAYGQAQPTRSDHWARHLDRVCMVPATDVYQNAYERWKARIVSHRAQLLQMRADARVQVGLGDASLFETALRLNPTYGVPVIPGSACKGLAKRIAAELDGLSQAATVAALFGTSTAENGVGLVRFLDAWWVPASAPQQYAGLMRVSMPDAMRDQYPGNDPVSPDQARHHGLVREITNPHHPRFHDTHERSEFDDPTPVPQLAAHGEFLFAVLGPEPWAERALDYLKAGLMEDGIGARTPEYGRFATVQAAGGG